MRDPIDDIDHDPEEELWYGFDWAAQGWLPEGDTIASAEWEITAVDDSEDPVLLVDDDTSIENTTETWIRLTGGTSGIDYFVTCKATTTPGGEVGRYSLLVRCR